LTEVENYSFFSKERGSFREFRNIGFRRRFK